MKKINNTITKKNLEQILNFLEIKYNKLYDLKKVKNVFVNITGVTELGVFIFKNLDNSFSQIEIRISSKKTLKNINFFDFNWNDLNLLGNDINIKKKYLVYFSDDYFSNNDISIEEKNIDAIYHLDKNISVFKRIILNSSLLKNLKIKLNVDISLTKQSLSKKIYSNYDVSVITVVYNNVKFIEQCIQSVINQNKNNFEYIVIDGKSNDGTLEIINKYKRFIDVIISEPDSGIFDAMNKGLKKASGKYKLFLNSDDLFFNTNSLSISLEDSNKAYVGKTIMIGEHINWFRPYNMKKKIDRYSHQSFFMPGILFFDMKYNVGSDTDLMNKFQKHFIYIPKIISIFRLGGHSSNDFNKDNLLDRFRLFGTLGLFRLLIKSLIIKVIGISSYEKCTRIKERYL